GDIWKERMQGTLRRQAVSPAALSSYLGGKLAAVAVVFLLIALVGALCMRWISSVRIGGGVGAGLWGGKAGSGGYVLMALVLMFASSERTASFLGNCLAMPLAMLGGSFFPFEMMPEWMAAIGKRTPNGWALVQFRKILDGQVDGGQLMAAGGALVIMA